MNPDMIFNGILIGCLVFLAVLALVALIRSIRGPKTADRIIAVNMIGTQVITMIVILAILLDEDYLADVGLVYAMVSFLSVVVLCKIYTGIYLEKRGIKDEKKAIDHNLEVAEARGRQHKMAEVKEGGEKSND